MGILIGIGGRIRTGWILGKTGGTAVDIDVDVVGILCTENHMYIIIVTLVLLRPHIDVFKPISD